MAQAQSSKGPWRLDAHWMPEAHGGGSSSSAQALTLESEVNGENPVSVLPLSPTVFMDWPPPASQLGVTWSLGGCAVAPDAPVKLPGL